MRRKWALHPPNEQKAQYLANQLRLHPVVGQILTNRGIQSLDEAKQFLNRHLSSLHDPELLPGVVEAAERIHRAAVAKKQIFIYGDYDVDGMCSIAILRDCLRLAGVEPRYYVPDRYQEGYGVNLEALRHLREKEKADLVITVDCGIASVAEAAAAKSLGLEYIVTDHHELPDELPPADVLVHPRLENGKYPFGQLCGTGVAFKLAWQIARQFSGQRRTTAAFQRFLLNATTLAAIGTVCDMVPMRGENRILVHHGLIALKKEPPLGLQKLLQVAGLRHKSRLLAGDIGFGIGPRLNACGRLGVPRHGVDLLTANDEVRAASLAELLDVHNKDRQKLERQLFREAKELAEQVYDLEDRDQSPALVLAGEKWSPGIIGIVAGRLAERFQRPTILIAWQGNKGSGSGRGIAGFEMHRAIQACRHLLLTGGGHTSAVGLSLMRDQFDAFRTTFEEFVRQQAGTQADLPATEIDAEVPLSVLTASLIDSLAVLEPFGIENRSPLLLSTNLQLVGEPRTVGGGDRHLSFLVRQNNLTRPGPVYKAIAFNMGDRIEELRQGQGYCCLIYTPSLNEYRGQQEVQLEVKDFVAASVVDDLILVAAKAS